MLSYLYKPTITIPIKAISYNRYYMIARGRYIITSTGRTFREEFEEALNEQLENYTPTDKHLKLGIDCYFKDNRRRDVDNMGKAILDCLTHSKKIFLDDSQIFELIIRKHNQETEKIVIEWDEM